MMKLRLKSTGKIETFQRLTWERSHNDPDLWEVIDEGDPVLMLQITAGVGRKELYYIDRDHATKIVNGNPGKYTFDSIDEADTLIPKIPFDPEKMNLEKRATEQYLAENPSKRDQRQVERTGSPTDFVARAKQSIGRGPQPVDRWLSKRIDTTEERTPADALTSDDITYLSQTLEVGTNKDKKEIWGMIAGGKFRFIQNGVSPSEQEKTWSLPKLEFHLWKVNFSLVWFSISLLTFFVGFYFRDLYSNVPFKSISEWDERSFWWAVIALISPGAYFLGKRDGHKNN